MEERTCETCDNFVFGKRVVCKACSIQRSVDARKLANAKRKEDSKPMTLERLLREEEEKAKKAGLHFGIREENLKIPDRCPVFRETRIVWGGHPVHLESPPMVYRPDKTKPWVPAYVEVISQRLGDMRLSDMDLVTLTRFTEWLNERVARYQW